jgi:FKBP-type peptidyl-prolyl cis-trans isomerase
MSNAKIIGGFVGGALVGAAVMSAVMQPKAPETAAQAAVVLDTQAQKSSYVIGTDIGGRLSAEGFEIDRTALVAGLDDALSGADQRLSEEEAHAAITAVIEERQAKAEERMQAAEAERAVAAEKNRAEGEAFLAANKEKEGVITTESGLQYKVIVEGSGENPTPEDTVQVHYRGTLIDGTEFDSSYARGEPAEFQVNRVIAGWTEALQLMSEGAKWELYIPSELAYGPRGAGADIGPDAVLIFEVELLKAKT